MAEGKREESGATGKIQLHVDGFGVASTSPFCSLTGHLGTGQCMKLDKGKKEESLRISNGQ